MANSKIEEVAKIILNLLDSKLLNCDVRGIARNSITLWLELNFPHGVEVFKLIYDTPLLIFRIHDYPIVCF